MDAAPRTDGWPGERPGPATWTVEVTEDGSWTFRHPAHGELCHSRSGAWLEARERYAAACDLARAAERRAREGRPLALLDVGTGIGWNVAAALRVACEAGAELAVTTLEADRSVVARAIEEGERRGGAGVPGAEWLASVHAALRAALAGGAGEPAALRHGGRDRGALALVLGDALETLPALDPAARFDAVFLDAFSPGREPALWSPDFLRRLAERLASGGRLSTYSAATRVRAGLAAAGLAVGPGPRVGAKAEGTLAGRDGTVPPFLPRVARRVERAARLLGP